jgi:hypothetical protein
MFETDVVLNDSAVAKQTLAAGMIAAAKTLRSSNMSTYTQFNISKTDFESTTLRQMSLPRLDELSDDCLLVEVERFAFTANNVTYAMLGDRMKYWQLFKAP